MDSFEPQSLARLKNHLTASLARTSMLLSGMTPSTDWIDLAVLLETAVGAAREAGKLLLEYARSGFRVHHAHGHPVYCVSIGLEYRGHCILGVVFDPSRDELFTATDEAGAQLNGQPISVSETSLLDASLLVTGFAYDIRETARNNLDHFAKFALKAQGLRRTGSAALDLCYVATGRFDGFWEVRLSPWDMAAGAVIVRQAKGRLTDFSGADLSIYGKELVASNGHIHQAMLTVLHEGPAHTAPPR